MAGRTLKKKVVKTKKKAAVKKSAKQSSSKPLEFINQMSKEIDTQTKTIQKKNLPSGKKGKTPKKPNAPAVEMQKEGTLGESKKLEEAAQEVHTTLEKVSPHPWHLRSSMILDFLLFIIGLLVIGYGLKLTEWLYLGGGVAVTLISLTLFISELLSNPEAEQMKRELKDEEKLLRKIDTLIDKERELKLKERELQIKLELYYHDALELDKKEQRIQHQMRVLEEKKNGTKKSWSFFKKKTPEPDDELKKVLLVMDTLLEKLPEQDIHNFSQSEEFKTYKKVMEKIK